MKKSKEKTLKIIFNCITVICIVAFEPIMYYTFGEEALLKKGTLRTIWLGFPVILVAISILIDYIIEKIYKNKQNKD